MLIGRDTELAQIDQPLFGAAPRAGKARAELAATGEKARRRNPVTVDRVPEARP